MLRRMVLLGIVLLAGAPAAWSADKNKLRQAVTMPRLGVQIGFFKFDTALGGLGMMDDKAPPPRTVEVLLPLLKGTVDDAAIYAELWASYGVLEKKDLAEKARQQAENLYRQQIKAQPGDVRLYVKLSQLLDVTKTDEPEMLVRKAIQLAPGDPDCWVELGGVLQTRILDKLHQYSGCYGPLQDQMEKFAAKNPPLEDVRAILKLIDDLLACHDKAIAASPKEARLYVRRYGERFFFSMIRPTLELMVDKTRMPKTCMEVASAPENLADLKKAIQLDPNNHLAIGAVITIELMASFKDGNVKDFGTAWKALSPATRAEIEDYIARLEKFTHSKDAKVAAGSAELLATVRSLKGDFKEAIVPLKLLVSLKPNEDESWDKLLMFMALGEDPEALAQTKKWVEHKDTAHTRYFLARAYVDAKDFAAAEKETRVALQRDPKDFHATLGLAALLLRRSDKDNTLPEAKEYLDRIGKRFMDLTDMQRNEFIVIYAIYLGLSDRVPEAMQALGPVLTPSQPPNKEARDVLNALNE